MEDIFNWCREGNTLQVRIWLDDTTNDMNEGDDHGFSPLHWACFAGRTNIVDMLLNRGARINATNMGDDTALHLAASHGHVECVNLLLKNKADVNALNEHGNTPLHYACFWGYQEIAGMLIAAGAQSNVANKDGDTPIDKCHRLLAQSIAELATAYNQDLSRKVAYRDATQVSSNYAKLRTRNAAISKHSSIALQDLNLTEKTAITTSGETWRGTWNNIEICAKFINYGPECTPRIVRDFTKEYPRLRIFSHPNVLPVIGCCNQPPSLVVVSEYQPYKSLYSLLHESKSFAVNSQQAIKFALDIARGMAFLHSLNPMVPRLYLNSFHVLIGEDLTAKINMADAKFSFQERNKIYQPAWMAPEALQKKESEINLQAADMWSFAMILWELSTRQVPFGGLSAIEIGMKVALEDLRVSITPGVSSHMARLTKICMNEEPGKRPTFDQIIPILTKMAHAR